MSEQSREWSIAEVAFGEVPPIPVVKVEVSPEPVAPKTARKALVDTITAWSVQYDLPLPEGVGVGIDLDGDLSVSLEGLTLVDGDIVVREREYLWTGVITVSVAVSGTVKAATEDEAHDLAEDALRNASIESVDVEAYHGDVCYEGHDIEDHDLHDVDEQ
jgi:hypothetical protein